MTFRFWRWPKTSLGEALKLKGEVEDMLAAVRHLGAKEVELGISEVRQNGARFLRAAAFAGAALTFGVVALFFVFLAVMLALETATPAWAAALLTALLAGLIGGLLGVFARHYARRVRLLPETVEFFGGGRLVDQPTNLLEQEVQAEREQIEARLRHIEERLRRDARLGR